LTVIVAIAQTAQHQGTHASPRLGGQRRSLTGNPFENFVRSLKADQQRINELEARIANVLLRLSSLELRSPKRLIDKVMTRRQVDGLLEASYRLRALADDVAAADPAAEVIIEIEKHRDGTFLVLPARTA